MKSIIPNEFISFCEIFKLKEKNMFYSNSGIKVLLEVCNNDLSAISND
jgi:hypothetical protein